MPGLEVIIATGNTPEILRRVEEGDLDAALVTLPAALGRSLAATRVATDRLVALLPEGIAPPGRPSLTAADLERLPLILYEIGANTRAIIDAWFRRAGLVPRPIMELGSVEAIKVLVAGGRGCSVLPALALGGEVASAVVRPLRPALARQLAVVLRKEKVVDLGLGRLLSALKAGGAARAEGGRSACAVGAAHTASAGCQRTAQPAAERQGASGPPHDPVVALLARA
jgi:DNA-binding transcriptional LysR family regulator